MYEFFGKWIKIFSVVLQLSTKTLRNDQQRKSERWNGIFISKDSITSVRSFQKENHKNILSGHININSIRNKFETWTKTVDKF